MNELQKDYFRRQLLTLAARLKGDVSGLREAALRGTGGDASGSLSNAPMHLADLGTDNFEQEVAVSLLQNEQQLLGAIGAALERLDNGTFGTCEQCGKPIPAERLKAMPYATRCVACQAAAEKAGTAEITG